ncbi:hypothetical protein HY382_02970 [Candidatus Curtissbacteria bacterium]|nr:hypothetical protein [Candidatus Curtissbacteria bacterium]
MKSRPKHFYSQLVSLEDLETDLGLTTVSGSEKEELMDLAHINLHAAIIDTILFHLTDSDKKKFLELMALGEDEKIWEHLNSKVEKIEEKITDTAKQIKSQLKEDIKKVKRN